MKLLFPSFLLISVLVSQARGVEPRPQSKEMKWIEPLVLGSSTYHKLMAAHARKGQAPICWFIDGSEGDKKIIYVGEDHADHTVRLETLRISKSGEVELMTYGQTGEILWVQDRKPSSANPTHSR